MLTQSLTVDLRASAALPRTTFASIRRAMILEHGKWDPQVGDVSTIAPFALLINKNMCRTLFSLAETLAAEIYVAERELLQRPDLWRTLAIPRSMCRLLRHAITDRLTPAAARVIRFDFHPTAEGWKISEANTDVPGGFTEAWNLPRLVADQLGESCHPIADPAGTLIDAMIRTARGLPIGLISAPGFMEDRQLVLHLAQRFRRAGAAAHVLDLAQITWRSSRAWIEPPGTPLELGAIFRFHQAEWLAAQNARNSWKRLFIAGATPVTNPATAIFSESKAFPLTWDHLQTAMPTWRAVLPETRPATLAAWRRSSDFILKPKFGNNGDDVTSRDQTEPPTLRKIERSLRWRPANWIMQRRFQTLPVPTPLGEMTPCVGVYVVNQRAAGIYGRLSRGPVIDYQAIDVAVLIDEEMDNGTE